MFKGRGQQTFSVKGQRVNILGLGAIGPMLQLSLISGSSHRQHVDRMCPCVPIKLYGHQNLTRIVFMC